MRFQTETSFIFYFYCGTVSRETGEKIAVFYDIFESKIKLSDGFMSLKWHKIMKPPDSVGKIETDDTLLRRGRQFQFFPTESGRF